MALKVGHVLRPALERFVEKTAPADNGCIVWTAGIASQAGYGYFYAGRTSREQTGRVYAHRWAYEHYVGTIPEGMEIDHLCRNRLCVNPKHLEAVTRDENYRRSLGNHRKSQCPAGHPYAGVNLYVTPSGGRQCRTCKKRASVKHRESHSRKA
ncbi:HNH endonuclease signature motif containing protein [Rhodococcus erythropolis]|uniref:HNH endonuclease signature motif containing protein n=1 Tax=Rhodococcus erythropolis TaxID=1833 RepID=UPI00398205E1